MRFSTVFRAVAVILVLLISGSNLIDLNGGPHNYVLDPGELEGDTIPGIDSDGDGLKDIHEDVNLDGLIGPGELVPTNPYDSDSDGDGLEDREEYDMYINRSFTGKDIPNWMNRFHDEQSPFNKGFSLLSPLGDVDRDGIVNIIDPDSDGDGLLDGAEVENGLDPLDPDSDFDLIPDNVDLHNGFSIDEDSNGMDDQWEKWFDLDGPEGDKDGDGVSNLLEFLRPSDPSHPDDRRGHMGDFSISDLFKYDTPLQTVFRTKGSGPMYHRVATFSKYIGGEWERDRSYTGTSVENGSISVVYDLNGYWWGDLPHSSWTTSHSIEKPYPTYPNSNSSSYYNNGALYSILPVGSLLIEVSHPEITAENLSHSNRTPSISSSYFQVPSWMPDEVWDLALEWSELSPSQKPFILADHMSRMIFDTCFYSLESNFQSPKEDPIYKMLFVTNKGNALDFASSFTILMRMVGVPSRLVMGYALGSVSGNMREFKMGHLHAWSEIYIEGYGWIPFEVTEHSGESLGGTGVRSAGKDPLVFGPYGGDGGGTLVGRTSTDLDPWGDEDFDGLNNSREWEEETDPFKWDSDGDLIDDLRELDVFGTDPNKKDTDEDGLTDGEEINEFGTLPTVNDTDGGGLWDSVEVYMSPPLDPWNGSDDKKFSDIDGDGLLNPEEKVLGTNEGDETTDDDDLKDGEEVISYRTDPLDPDSDDDGLLDHEEVFGLMDGRFSDPNEKDTDGDGLEDGEEIEYGTSPTIFDTDNDGIGDGNEVERGLDPLDPDMDDDGLPDGREDKFLTSPTNHDSDGDGRWDAYEIWSGTLPNNPDDPPFMRDIDQDGLSDDDELRIGTSISNNDTDGDGLYDGLEYKIIGTSPTTNDTDGDGLNDSFELLYVFTSPFTNDTDNDDLTDRFEINIGSSPRERDSDLDGLADVMEFDGGTDWSHPDTDRGGITDLLEIMFQKDPLDPEDDFPIPDDEDGDGLPDLLEMSLNTSVNNPDTDGDGLTDGEEFFSVGTSPRDRHSDNDSLEDGIEVKRYLTDPLNHDTDGDGLDDDVEIQNRITSPLLNDTDNDGLMDGLEIELGTKPGVPDSDGDGLSDGDEHFDIGTEPNEWDTDRGNVSDGREVELGGNPLDPSDDIHFTDTDDDGLLDSEEDIDMDGEVDPDETDPNDPDTDGDGIWDSYEVWGVHGTPSDPLDEDTDDDGLWDGEELLEGSDGFISDPTLNDTDNDGMGDPEEVFGTFGMVSDPSSKDGDGDGLLDTQEVFVSGTDPLDEDTDDDGLPDGWIDGWRGSLRNGKADVGEYEDRDLDGTVDEGPWGNGEGPGETDPLKFDTDGGGVGDGDELFHLPEPFDPLNNFDDVFALDTDGDGLTDLSENGTLGTDWLLIDTDGDGMADGELDIEVDDKILPGELKGHNGWGPSDPLVADIDKDGLNDGEEYLMGTNPNSPDSDMDELYDGYDVIIGLDGSPHFGELSGRNIFDSSQPYAPTDPLDPDTDDDGLWDGADVQIGGSDFYGEYPIGTDPNDPDTDNDGLTDHDEFKTIYEDSKVKWSSDPEKDRKTNPLDPDTDDGMMTDGLEVEKGLNPLDPDDDDDFLDTDGDGLLNGYEKRSPFLYFEETTVDWTGDGIRDHRPNWNDSDTDDDGLTDGEEVWGDPPTNPVHNDTDEDLLLDGEEVKIYNTNPLLPDSDDDGLNDDSEVLYIFEEWQSYVDWNNDGIFDNKTDPNNRDTDSDSLEDGREARDKTNPLDPGDPGREYQPEKSTNVIIHNAPGTITKTELPMDNPFKVTGIVRSEDHILLENVDVTILVVPRNIGPEDAIELRRNPSYGVGSFQTDENGEFTVLCTPWGKIPYGEVNIYAVTRQKRMDGRLFLPSISEPSEAEVKTSSEIHIITGGGPYSIGSTVLFTALIQDIGDVPISNSIVTLSTGWGFSDQLVASDDGLVSTPLSLPSEVGQFEIDLEFDGSEFITPTSSSMDIMTIDGPVIVLEDIPTQITAGSRIRINGSIFGAGIDPQGDVEISVTSSLGGARVSSFPSPIDRGSFSHELELSAALFKAGSYSINVLYEVGPSNLAVNASLSFKLVGRSFILLGQSVLVRGIEEDMNIFLFGGDLEPIIGERIRVTFPGSPWLGSYVGMTNKTGWASVNVPLPSDMPLGQIMLEAVHESEDLDIFGAHIFSNISIRAQTRIEVLDRVDIVTLQDDIIFKGRLIDDLGNGITSERSMDLLINGEMVQVSNTDSQGFFEFTHTFSFVSLGPGIITIRFSDIPDERAGWYVSNFISWDMIVHSRVLLETSLKFNDHNTTLSIVMRDQNRDPIHFAPLRVGSSYLYKTYLTDKNGSVELELGRTEPGQIVDMEFSGDPSRYLIPASINITIPETNISSSKGMDDWIYAVLIITCITVVVAAGIIIQRRRRIDTGSRRVEEARTGMIYPFEPKKGAQEIVYKSYKNILSYLREKGMRRTPEMTPDEFDEAVRSCAKNGDLEKLEEMTQLFDEVRYSDHELSSHLISKAKTIENELEKEIAHLEEEGLKEKFEKAREEMILPVPRHIIWKMKLDHEGDLKDLIGDKGGDG